MTPPNPWLTVPSHSSLVPINGGQVSLHANIAGPISTSSPLVIIEAGLGDCSTTWIPTVRLLSQHARVFSYDRSGFGQSSPPPEDQALTAAQRVRDLRALLKATGLKGPYVLVGHSYGGTFVREFLRQAVDKGRQGQGKHGEDDEVVGMVLVDSMTTTSGLSEPNSMGEIFNAEGDDAYAHVVGLDTNHVYSDEEWEAVKAGEKANGPVAGREAEHAEKCTNEVSEGMGFWRSEAGEGKEGRKCGFRTQPLGEHRLSCIFGGAQYDFFKVVENAEKRSVGSQQARKELREFVEKYAAQEVDDKRAALDLSRQSRWVEAEGRARTHNMHYTAPEVIVKEVLWVLGISE